MICRSLANEVQGGGLAIKVHKVTADQVILKISKA